MHLEARTVAAAQTDEDQRGPGEQSGPLSGLVVVDLSTTAPGAHATQFLAEAGAEVILIEQPGGSPLRKLAAWPVLGGGKRSIGLDVHDDADREALTTLIARADVLVTTMRPQTAERLGLGPAPLAELNPRLVSAAITGWGSTGPWASLKGYEGMVMAKLGMCHAKRGMVPRPGPAFVSVPYATWGAAQTAVQGILAALLEREASGRGQHVETDLVRGAGMIDTWNWFAEMISIRWPGAYASIDAFTADGEPLSPILYPLLIAPTKDGVWLQFAQVEPRLFGAMLQEFGLMPLMADPAWKGLPKLESQERRTELWELMIAEVGKRTLTEWQQVFDSNPNISAEVYRSGPDALNHPQIQWEGRDVSVDDPEHGPVRRPSALVFENDAPLSTARPAPRLDHDGADLRAVVAPAPKLAEDDAPAGRLPLEHVKILDLGLMFAGPFGATVLTDLGARVVKVETLTGDTIRNILPFPESGGARVMQGKESISLDLQTEEGKQIVHELARHCDVVLQAYRAGGAARAGVDEKTLRELNPNLVYVNAPGYGTGGPYGARPAYAPSIGAAAGYALTDAPDAAAATASMEDKKTGGRRLNKAIAVPVMQSDGVSALGVASTMLLGLVGRARNRPMGPLTVTMLGTGISALVDRIVDYPDRPDSPTVDSDGYGYSALYRLYPTADGWVFLAAPAETEWPDLVAALSAEVDLGAGDRFATASARTENDAALAEILTGVFARRAATDWEKELTAAGVGCVQAAEAEPGVVIQTDPALAEEYATTAMSPIFDEHLRVAPPYRFSRSATQAKGGCLAGEHTDAILREIGYGDEKIADLRARAVVGG
jgi:crotonobetainyl-CoA:carnitine CoA-transferase CaiB-like acyl-CoA transferase